MKDWPTDPMRQHDRLIAAFCDDLFDMVVHNTSGTPRADRVCEINRQVSQGSAFSESAGE